jgi:hypothetical protein
MADLATAAADALVIHADPASDANAYYRQRAQRWLEPVARLLTGTRRPRSSSAARP